MAYVDAQAIGSAKAAELLEAFETSAAATGGGKLKILAKLADGKMTATAAQKVLKMLLV